MGETGEGWTPLDTTPVVGKHIRKFDETVGQDGLQKAMKDLMNLAEAKLEVRGKDQKTTEILRNKPVLLIANHPFDAEFMPLFASLPSREDMYVVGTLTFMGVGPNFREHLIPVYTGHLAETEHNKLSVRFGRKLPHNPKLGYKEAKKMNTQAIDTAIERINEGGMVTIFPEGLRGKGGKWFSGVGKILKGLEDNSDAYLVNTHIQGTSNLDFMRIVPGVRRLLPPLVVNYSKPRQIDDVVAQDISAHKLTRDLQSEYNTWSKNLS